MVDVSYSDCTATQMLLNYCSHAHGTGSHSQEPIDSNDESDVISRKSDRGQYNHHSDQACLRDASSSNTGCSRCNTSGETHRHTQLCIYLTDRQQNMHQLFLVNLLPDGDDLTKVHLHVVDLGDEDGCQRLIKSCSIHVDGGTDGKHEACDSLVNFVVLFQTFKGDRESG